MSKIKFGSVITDVRGKAGGVVFSKALSGATLSVRSSRVNRVSPLQAALRNQTNILMKRFRFILSSSQREQWSFFSSHIKTTNVFGDVSSISPINIYVRCNTIRHQAWREFPGNAIFNGLEFLDDPPTDTSITVIDISIKTIFTRVFIDGFTNLGFGLESRFAPPGHTLCMQCTGPIPGGVLNFEKSFRFLTSFAATNITPTGIIEYGNFGKKWGAQPSGTLIAGRVILLNVKNGFTRKGPSFKTGIT